MTVKREIDIPNMILSKRFFLQEFNFFTHITEN